MIFTSPLQLSDLQLTPKMTYEEAKSYCRPINSYLAEVYKLAENVITDLASWRAAERIWIGLELGELWIWHWTGPDQGTSFVNWRTGEPQDKQEVCAAMDQNGTWFANDCGIQKSFVCQGR